MNYHHLFESPVRLALAAVGSIAVLVILWFSLSLYPHNSDHYFFPKVAQNLVEQGGSLSDWVLMSAPRYFPDLLIEVISFSIVGSGNAGLALGSALLVLLQWFAVSLLTWRIGAGAVTAVLAGMLYCATCMIVGPHYTSFSYIVWHSGTFSIILICFGLMLDPEQRPGPLAILVTMVLAALVSASNMLTLPILIPGMGLLSLIYLIQNYQRQTYLMRYSGWWRLVLVPAFTTLTGCLLGVLLYRHGMPYPFTNPVDASSLNMGLIKDPRLAFQAGMNTLVTLSTLPVFIVSFFTALASLVLLRRTRQFPLLLAATGFWLFTSCLNQGLIELGAKDELRYRIMPINGSIAMLSVSIALLGSRWRLGFALPAVAAILAGLTWQDVQTTFLNRHLGQIDETTCLQRQVETFSDRERMHAGEVVGVSDHPATKMMPYLSSGALRLIATKGSSKSVLPYMLEAPLMAHLPTYVIAKIGHDPSDYEKPAAPYLLSERNAVEQYGTPAARLPCSYRVVLHYPDGLRLTPPRHLGIKGPEKQ